MVQAVTELPAAEPVFGLAAVDAQAASLPFGLKAQFRRHGRRYAAGFVLLALYQYSQFWFDTHFKDGVNLADAGKREQAVWVGIWLVVVALAGFGVRVLSRVAVFNAGRNAEYEIRRVLSAKLLTLGPSFYRRM